ncbi:hypothetical protein GCM10010172_79250 [Paractinoplanes ferrugineus]|uniref:DUF11 domain-containing protein n=1 Tax=Paractinoplanes ferrugineus TaxID=113564 RepID=A0A919J5K6_9ACTN|nr:hypothetical protein [Actinoplanes ferrugineus]GIE12999.1 hypothetical protein Afe05nite_48390 [Actinoplanes ferrugineus]
MVLCAVDLPARIELPVVVPEGIDPGKKLAGGCVDAALDTAAPDGKCDDAADVPIPPLVVGRHAVNLAVHRAEPARSLTSRTPLRIRIPYANEGTQTAENVRFTLVPPPGVTVRSAAARLNTESKIAAATAIRTVACTTTGRTVTCQAPDAPALRRSELWLTLTATGHAHPGTRTMTVTIATSSTEGNAADNATTVEFELAALDGGRDLAVTGSQVTGLATLAALLAGMGALLMAVIPKDPYRPRHAAGRAPHH